MTSKSARARTVETCAHRHDVLPAGADGDEVARCRLLEHFLGPAGAGRDFCEVRRDACEACVDAFPPSIDDLNDVLASLLYQATDGLLLSGRADGIDRVEAERLRDWAMRSIPLMFPDEGDAPALPSTLDECGWVDLERIVPRPARSSSPGVTATRWAVGVTTAPRRLPTLEYCLDALIGSGWADPMLFVDSDVAIPARFSKLARTIREPKVGAWPNYYLALAELTLRHPTAEAYLLLQDDALLIHHPRLRSYIESLLWPGDCPGIVSLYGAGSQARATAGWHSQSTPWFWGALAFIFPAELAERFLADPDVIEHRRSGPADGLAMIDLLIGQFAHRCGIPIHVPTPSLVQHIGHVSTLWPTARASGIRRAGRFAGDLIDQAPDPTPPRPRPFEGIRLFRRTDNVIGTGVHRSGWPYAVRALVPLSGPDGVLFDDFIEQEFCYHTGRRIHREPWVGIFHHPPNMPPFMRQNHAPAVIFQTERWKQSRPNLLAAIALSDYLADYLAETLGVPTFSVKMPSGVPETQWERARYLSNPRKQLIQIGWYLKNTQLIYEIPEPLDHGRMRLLPADENVVEYDGKVARHWRGLGTRGKVEPWRVVEHTRVSDERFDELLAENVVAIELFDASANNAICDCIARGTPLVVNRHPAVVEYLGHDYPLYFSDPTEVPDLVTTDRVIEAHHHLVNLDRSWLAGASFQESIRSILKTILGWA